MDGRWLLVSLVVAVVAAVRWRRRAPEPTQRAGSTEPIGQPNPGRDGRVDRRRRHPRSDGVEGRRADAPDAEAGSVEAGSVEAGSIEAGNIEAGNIEAGSIEGGRLDGDSVEIDSTLGAALERVWAEYSHDAEALLDARLRQLVQRKVPVRAIRRAPGGRAVRVAFADGTVVLCRGSGQGDFGRLGLAVHRQSVRLGTFAHDEQVTRLEFRWNPGQRLAAVAVGLDQPD